MSPAVGGGKRTNTVVRKLRHSGQKAQLENGLDEQEFGFASHPAVLYSEMSLVARVSLSGPPAVDPEDYLFSALSVIFPDDTTNQHGDADHGVLYTSPHLPEPLQLSLTDPMGQSDRDLFSHYLWNSSLMLAKLVEAGTLDGAAGGGGRAGADVAALRGSGPVPVTEADAVTSEYCSVVEEFDITDLSTIELGAGTALPSILAALLGASRVAITDYPSDVVINNLKENIVRNIKGKEPTREIAQGAEAQAEPILPTKASRNPISKAVVSVDGHEWGVFGPEMAAGHHAYDRVFVCDCLWMPWQHDNLRKSIDWFLKEQEEDGGDANKNWTETAPRGPPRCWVVAGFHTGREKVAAFFNKDALTAVNLEIQAIWERDCDDKERPWQDDRGIEDSTERKRWLAIAILRRKQRRPERSE